MFRKILVANRGEIAVRIIRACQELDIATVALYQAADQGSLHVRLADECVFLGSPKGFMDHEAILRIACERSVDAIHPGYGFLAEREDFARACHAARIAFIGPPVGVLDTVRWKPNALARASEAGFLTPAYSTLGLYPEDFSDSPDENGNAPFEDTRSALEDLPFPLVIKSCRGGRGRGEHLVWSPDRLVEVIRKCQAESKAFYGESQVYWEKAILPAHQIGVQVMGDLHGNRIHLGEREGSLINGNQKLIEEAPAPCLNQIQRERLWQAALDLARLFKFQNVGTVEFLMDEQSQFYFTEIKPRIQIEHPLTEMISRIDLVRNQILLAAGEPLTLKQEDVSLNGWAMQCRISAEDPLRHFLPNPGRLHELRLPGGMDVRTDTYVYSGCNIPGEYDPLIAKLIVWGTQRSICLERMRQALQEIRFSGIATNVSFLQQILDQPDFFQGHYNSSTSIDHLTGFPAFGDGKDHRIDVNENDERGEEETYRDLAVAAIISYLRKSQAIHPSLPDRLLSGWHRHSRRLSE
jgi:acetyl-CoA carboxylase biotin carboxylase subunit